MRKISTTAKQHRRYILNSLKSNDLVQNDLVFFFLTLLTLRLQKVVDEVNKSERNAAEDEAKDDDIIQIIQEPEILCITSSDSENEDAQFLNKVKRSYITMPMVEKEVRPPTADELFLEKVKHKTSLEVLLKQSTEKGVEETSSKTEGSEKTANCEGAAKAVEEAPEDGEIVEDDIVEDAPVESDIVDLAESSDEETQSTTKNCELVVDEKKSEVHEEESIEKSIEEKSSSKDSDGDTGDEDSTDLVNIIKYSGCALCAVRRASCEYMFNKQKKKNSYIRRPIKLQNNRNDLTMKTKISSIWAKTKILISKLKMMQIQNRR